MRSAGYGPEVRGGRSDRALDDARASVDGAVSWVMAQCSDEELVVLDAGRHHLATHASSAADLLRREAELLMRWSATVAVAEASFADPSLQVA